MGGQGRKIGWGARGDFLRELFMLEKRGRSKIHDGSDQPP